MLKLLLAGAVLIVCAMVTPVHAQQPLSAALDNPAARPGVQERCTEASIDVTAASADERRLACDAAAQALQLLARCTISPRRPLRIELSNEVRRPFGGTVFGLFDPGRKKFSSRSMSRSPPWRAARPSASCRSASSTRASSSTKSFTGSCIRTTSGRQAATRPMSIRPMRSRSSLSLRTCARHSCRQSISERTRASLRSMRHSSFRPLLLCRARLRALQGIRRRMRSSPRSPGRRGRFHLDTAIVAIACRLAAHAAAALWSATLSLFCIRVSCSHPSPYSDRRVFFWGLLPPPLKPIYPPAPPFSAGPPNSPLFSRPPPLVRYREVLTTGYARYPQNQFSIHPQSSANRPHRSKGRSGFRSKSRYFPTSMTVQSVPNSNEPAL